MYVCDFDRGMRENGKERGGVGKEAYVWGNEACESVNSTVNGEGF